MSNLKENIEDDNREEIGKGKLFVDDINKTERKRDIIEKGKKKKKCDDIGGDCDCSFSCRCPE
jgi:hypothetical protein